MSIESFKDIEKRCIGVACKGGYYPLDSKHIKIWANETKDIPDGTYIGPDYKPTTFTQEEWRILCFGC